MLPPELQNGMHLIKKERGMDDWHIFWSGIFNVPAPRILFVSGTYKIQGKGEKKGGEQEKSPRSLSREGGDLDTRISTYLRDPV
jgi:hypothetical protein